jgi:hypothetical protein
LKQFSVIVIILSAILSIATHFMHQIHLYFGHLEKLYPAITIYIRFGELTLLLGFIGIFLTSKRLQLKILSLSMVLIGVIHFFLIEFGVIAPYDNLSNVLLISKLMIITLFVLQFRSFDLGLFMVKGYFLIFILTIYGIAYIVLILIDKPIVNETSTTLTGTMLTAFFILFEFGILNFFKEWYREAFTYNNKVLSDI